MLHFSLTASNQKLKYPSAKKHAQILFLSSEGGGGGGGGGGTGPTDGKKVLTAFLFIFLVLN